MNSNFISTFILNVDILMLVYLIYVCYTFFVKQFRVNCFNILKDSDINMGNSFYKIITCEMARLQTWEITADLKQA